MTYTLLSSALRARKHAAAILRPPPAVRSRSYSRQRAVFWNTRKRQTRHNHVLSHANHARESQCLDQYPQRFSQSQISRDTKKMASSLLRTITCRQEAETIRTPWIAGIDDSGPQVQGRFGGVLLTPLMQLPLNAKEPSPVGMMIRVHGSFSIN